MEITKESIQKLDLQNVYGSVAKLAEQCRDAWEQASKVNVPESFKSVRNVVMCGMGGSGLGARVIESVYADDLKIPLTRVNSYNLPGFADENSLVFCSSYSGTTEETLENARQAMAKKAKWVAIGTGNSLIQLAEQNNAPYYQINPIYNPSNQPRMAIGYSIIGQLVLAGKAGLISLFPSEIDEIFTIMKGIFDRNKAEVDGGTNLAKKVAEQMHGKIVVHVSAGHLVGAAHVVNNQQNENAKNMCLSAVIPELNHHLMEGLKNPDCNKKNLHFVFFNSGLYSDRIKQRFAITKEVVEKQGVSASEVNLNSSSQLSQAFELIQFGALVNFYLAVLYGQDPAPIPWVDYFKNRLGQSLGK